MMMVDNFLDGPEINKILYIFDKMSLFLKIEMCYLCPTNSER